MSRQTVGWLGSTLVRKQDEGELRRQKDVCEKLSGRRGDDIENGQKLDRGVAVQRGIGLATEK